MENILRVQAEVGGKLNRTELTLSRQDLDVYRITSYNVCYTKLLRI